MTDPLLNFALECTERGWIPDRMVRAGIRALCRQRLREEEHGDEARIEKMVQNMLGAPIAPLPRKANEQHYEAPLELFLKALGPHLKYSCCYWPEEATSLAQAEEASLEATCEHAEIEDGQQILELGCGWGSLCLWMARRYRRARILAVSNSRVQRLHIESVAEREGLTNLRVVTADMNHFSPEGQFDRVVSVEMFEHMRNYARLLNRIATWMRHDAKLFIHVFCHRKYAYEFETTGATNWLGRHFFTGGIMPSEDLLLRFQESLRATRQWRWSGVHYEKTANAWLGNLDAARGELMPVFRRTYGPEQAERWFERWRVFFMACAELWGYGGGSEWFVSHYLFEPARAERSRSDGCDGRDTSVPQRQQDLQTAA